MQWNPGSKHLHNKLGNIESVINGYKPDILGISESNFFKHHDINDVQIDNYKLFLSDTLDNENIKASRIAVYVHDDIVCKVRKDLMNDTFSSIWLEVSLPRQKKFLVCHAYREWQYMNQATNESKSIPAQNLRWIEFLDQWERALKTDLECLVAGDLNIDHTAWTKLNPPKTSSTYKLKTLIENLFDRILPLGAVQCVNGPTRFESGVASSGLDHFWTSNPNKLSDIHSYFHGSSDHKIIIGTRYTKCVVRNSRYVKKRSYKNFNTNEFIQAIQSTSWWDLYSCEDPEQAVEIFTQKLNIILDEMAPIIVNLSISQSYFPSAWKTSKVIPLLKKNDVTLPQNYRPVALLPIASKILERVIYLQLIEYLEGNNLLHHSHHGFRKHHSTTSVLLEMYSSSVREI
jgi:hypothetical protein